jgi:hypothetical protein
VGNLEGRLVVLLGLNEGANKGLSEDGDDDCADGMMERSKEGIYDGDLVGDDADNMRG